MVNKAEYEESAHRPNGHFKDGQRQEEDEPAPIQTNNSPMLGGPKSRPKLPLGQVVALPCPTPFGRRHSSDILGGNFSSGATRCLPFTFWHKRTREDRPRIKNNKMRIMNIRG